MSSENPKKSSKPSLLPTMFASTLAVAALGLASYSIFELKDLIEQQEQQEQQKNLHMSHTENNFTFKSEAEFKKAVVSTLNEIALERNQESLDSKLDSVELAPETAPDGRKIYGNLNARFSLVEFSETECPFCIRHQDTMKSLVDTSKGNINWEWKHLPLGSHNPAAMTQAVIGECIAEQKGNRYFWAYIDEVFESSRGNGQGVQDLLGLVESYDVDLDEIRKCAASSEARAIVDEDIELAGSLGISGTPATFVVDNQTGNSQVVTGAQPSGVFTSTIKRLMDQADVMDQAHSNAQEVTQE